MQDKLLGYFDYAAATPILPEVMLCMEPFLTTRFYNPSALYLASKANKKSLDEARHSVAKSLGARPAEIIFTAGGTEANNLAIKGIMAQYPDGNIVSSSIEHSSVLEPASQFNNFLVIPNKKGIVNPADIGQLVNDKTVLISIMYANNEIGSIQPINEISQLVNQIRQDRVDRNINTPLYFHVDGCQAANYLDMHVARLGVDMLTINSGKIYGPKQTGALFVKTGIKLNPLINGGGQERNLRSGTENLANIIGFATSLNIVSNSRRSEAKRLSELRDNFTRDLVNKVPNITINGSSGNKRLANNISVTLPGQDNERLLMILDEHGFMVATGSACSASSSEPSHVLKAIGLTDAEARSSIRITLGRSTTKESLESLANCLVKTLE